MFYIISKLLAFLIQPVNWIVILFIISLSAKAKKWKKRSLWGAFIGLLFFTNPLIVNLSLDFWEIDPVSLNSIPQEAGTGVVLGGYFRQTNDIPRDRFNLNERPNRLVNSLELLDHGIIDRLILSGGNGSLRKDLIPEALLVDSLLDAWCWADSLTLTEAKSRNTYENILYTRELMEAEAIEGPIVLITSAFHMRRALAICKKQGLEAYPFPTDPIRREITWTPKDWLLPDAGALSVWNILIKEWVGMIVYKVSGYI
ncbi:MAG: YdcF family protein [Bacteroidetes bacterium]|nr:YdcF family protein [Bacteroidota bacterium]